MINIVIAYDNQNAGLGQYFEDCKEDITTLLEEQNHLIKSCSKVPSPKCNEAYIDFAIPQLNSDPFVFVSYMHGIDDGLKCGGGFFISTNNCHHFTNSFFYSTACLIGRKLAPELIVKGCKAFIGFKEESEVFKNASYRQTFIECDNYALKMFITSNKTIGEAFVAMKDHYTKKIDRSLELGESPLFIGALIANREALVCLGNDTLKKEDFFVQ